MKKSTISLQKPINDKSAIIVKKPIDYLKHNNLPKKIVRCGSLSGSLIINDPFSDCICISFEETKNAYFQLQTLDMFGKKYNVFALDISKMLKK